MEEEGLVGSKAHNMLEGRSLRLDSAATVSRSLVGGAAVLSTVVTISVVLVLVRSRNVPAAVIVFVAVSRQSVLVRTRLGQPSAAHLAFDVKERMLDLLDALAVATVVVGEAVTEADVLRVREAHVRVKHHLRGLAPLEIPSLPLVLVRVAADSSLRTPAVHEHLSMIVLAQVAMVLGRHPRAPIS